jgi:hypothetical protein
MIDGAIFLSAQSKEHRAESKEKEDWRRYAFWVLFDSQLYALCSRGFSPLAYTMIYTMTKLKIQRKSDRP